MIYKCFNTEVKYVGSNLDNYLGFENVRVLSNYAALILAVNPLSDMRQTMLY